MVERIWSVSTGSKPQSEQCLILYGLISQSMLSVDGEEISGKALKIKKVILDSRPESRKNRNGHESLFHFA